MNEPSDDELLAIIQRRSHEWMLSRVGCMTAAAIAMTPAMGAANAWTPDDLPGVVRMLVWVGLVGVGGLCTFPLVGLLLGPLIALRELRARKEIRELRRRWGQSPMIAYAARAQAMLAAGGSDARGRPPPDFVVVFQAKGLPGGRQRFLRVDLWDRPKPKAEAEQRRAPPVLEAADSEPMGSLAREEGHLPADLTRALRDRLRELGDSPPRRRAHKGGMACHATVVSRDPLTKRELKADLTSSAPTDETTAVLSLLLAASEALIREAS